MKCNNNIFFFRLFLLISWKQLLDLDVVLHDCGERAKSECIVIIIVLWLFSNNILNSVLDQDNSGLVSPGASTTALRSNHFQALKPILCSTHSIMTFTFTSWSCTGCWSFLQV